MLHITCDHCGRSLEASETRFVVRVEIFAAHEPVAITDADFDVDHMEAVSQTLEEMEVAGYPEPCDPGAHELRFDLCLGCRKRYLRDPLGKDNAQKLHFSEN
jgi:hypothetical protein